MKNYIIEKTKIKEGKSSGVSVGSKSASDFCTFQTTDDDVLESPELKDLGVGMLVTVYSSPYFFNRTSQVTKIIELGDDFVEFETGSSVYMLKVEL